MQQFQAQKVCAWNENEWPDKTSIVVESDALRMIGPFFKQQDFR